MTRVTDLGSSAHRPQVLEGTRETMAGPDGLSEGNYSRCSMNPFL